MTFPEINVAHTRKFANKGLYRGLEEILPAFCKTSDNLLEIPESSVGFLNLLEAEILQIDKNFKNWYFVYYISVLELVLNEF